MDSKNLSSWFETCCAALGPILFVPELLTKSVLVVVMLMGKDTWTGLACKFNEW